jgi:hypothetical protein
MANRTVHRKRSRLGDRAPRVDRVFHAPIARRDGHSRDEAARFVVVEGDEDIADRLEVGTDIALDPAREADHPPTSTNRLRSAQQITA